MNTRNGSVAGLPHQINLAVAMAFRKITEEN
jgi:hypothetical protein